MSVFKHEDRLTVHFYSWVKWMGDKYARWNVTVYQWRGCWTPSGRGILNTEESSLTCLCSSQRNGVRHNTPMLNLCYYHFPHHFLKSRTGVSKRQPLSQLWPAVGFVNAVWGTVTSIRLRIIWGCSVLRRQDWVVLTEAAEWQTLRCSLSGPLQRKSADPWSS